MTMIEWLKALFITQTLFTPIDGDTIRLSDQSSVRLEGFNTPEIFSPKCGKEKELGIKARERVKSLVKENKNVILTIHKRECAYGRKCGTLTINGKNVGDILIEEGLAENLVCNAGKCPKPRSWCHDESK